MKRAVDGLKCNETICREIGDMPGCSLCGTAVVPGFFGGGADSDRAENEYGKQASHQNKYKMGA